MKTQSLFLKLTTLLGISFVLSLVAYGIDLDQAKLEQEKPIVCITSGGNTKRVEGAILINASVQDCWKVISDMDALAEWAPRVKYSKTVKKEDGHSIVIGGTGMLFMTAHYTEEVIIDDTNKTISCRQLSDEEVENYKKMGIEVVKSNFAKVLNEDQRLEPYGDKTVWIVIMDLDLKMPMPGWLENYACKVMVPGFLNAGKKRIEHGQAYQK